MTLAAAREADEEVGIVISPANPRVVGVVHRKSNDERIDFFLEATRWMGQPTNPEPAMCDDLRWDDPEDLPANVIPYVRRAIENWQAGRWFDSFGWD